MKGEDGDEDKMVVDGEPEKSTVTQSVMLYATTNSIKVLSTNDEPLGSKVLFELPAEAGASFTFVRVRDDKVIASL